MLFKWMDIKYIKYCLANDYEKELEYIFYNKYNKNNYN